MRFKVWAKFIQVIGKVDYAPILIILDPIKLYEVFCNASKKGLGGVLIQYNQAVTYALGGVLIQDNQVMTYASRQPKSIQF